MELEKILVLERKVNVILYPRVSSLVQTKGDSIEGQLLRFKQFCEQKGHTVIDTYTDAGKSASISDTDDLNQAVKNGLFVNNFNINKRPGFKRLLEEAPSKKFDAIVFFKWDRLFRDVAFADLSQRYFNRFGITLIPTDDPIDPFASSIMNILSKQEIIKMKERVRQSRLARFESGMMVAKAPYGYRFNPKAKCIEIDKRKSDIVKDIFLEASQGVDYRLICKKHHIAPQQYYNIIKNKVYMGVITFEGLEKLGNHPAIITKELYDKVNGINGQLLVNKIENVSTEEKLVN